MTPSDLFKYAISAGFAGVVGFFVFMLVICGVLVWRATIRRR